jgi:hypothetical protein
MNLLSSPLRAVAGNTGHYTLPPQCEAVRGRRFLFGRARQEIDGGAHRRALTERHQQSLCRATGRVRAF